MPFGALLNAMLSSDIGHRDVFNSRHVMVEFFSLLKNRLMGKKEYCDFLFGNVARLHCGMDLDPCRGTTTPPE